MDTKSYTIETPDELWRNYDDLVPEDRKINDRIVTIMALDCVAHSERLPDETVRAAKAILRSSPINVEGFDGAVEP